MSEDLIPLTELEAVPTNRAVAAMKEIEAKITVALKFPRDMAIVESEIKAMCQRPRFADGSTYALPRGDKVVNGPSVHFAKGIAQLMRNFEHGHVIEARGVDFTSGFAFAWDYERNNQVKKDFYVKHERKVKSAPNGIKKVTDPIEITEMVNAQISRAVRNAIIELIPWYLIEEAQEICQATLRAEAKKKPIEKRREDAKELFKSFGVDDERIKKKYGKPFSELGDEELFEAGKAYNAIKDKFITVASWLGEEANENQASNLESKIKEQEEAAKKESPKENAADSKTKAMKEEMKTFNDLTKGIKL